MTLFGIFEQPALVQLAGFSVFSAAAWAGARLLLKELGRRYGSGAGGLPVGPAFATVTIVFSLFTGFLAADIWQQKHRAIDAAYAEQSGIDRFVTVVGPGGLNAPRALRAVERYKAMAIEGEWHASRNRSADARAQAALREMQTETMRLAEEGTSAPVVSHLFAVLDDIVAARNKRLAIGADHDGNNAWFSVIVLCLFSYIAIVIVHLDRPAGGVLALTIFACATTFTFWFLALHDSPYAGGVRLEAELLETVQFFRSDSG